MTILNLVADSGDQLPSRQISKRIRGLMAENRISGVKLADAIGMGQKAFSRRYADEVDWTIDELARVAVALGVSLVDLVDVTLPAITLSEDAKTPGGGTLFLSPGEGGAPSGTRTPNPLISSRKRHLELVRENPRPIAVADVARPRLNLVVNGVPA